MAVLFNEKEFEELILEKGKDFGDPVVVEVELEAFKNAGHLEYLFFVYKFCLALEENEIPYLVRYDDYPSYMIQILGLDCPDTTNLLQNWKYDRKRKDEFQIYIPNGMRKKAISLFSEIAYVEFDIDDADSPFTLVINHKYHLDIIQHGYLPRLSKINPLIRKNIKPNDKSVIDYMIQTDQFGLHMPNLYECCYGDMDLWYSIINVAKPKNLEDLRKIVGLISGIFSNRKVLINQIKEYGLNEMICCRQQLYSVLCDCYDLDKERVDAIRMNLNVAHRLSESDELLLESNGVPKHIIEQLKNIRYLPYAVHPVVSVEIMYRLAYLKKNYWDEFSKAIIHDDRTFVGPFFYIDGKLVASKKAFEEFDSRLRFYDSNISHFDFFNSLHIDGDYGNYPRGRVICDNYHRRYIVYLDKCLLKDEIKTQIKKCYSLEDEIVVFEKDSHYTHDGL